MIDVKNMRRPSHRKTGTASLSKSKRKWLPTGRGNPPDLVAIGLSQTLTVGVLGIPCC